MYQVQNQRQQTLRPLKKYLVNQLNFTFLQKCCQTVSDRLASLNICILLLLNMSFGRGEEESFTVKCNFFQRMDSNFHICRPVQVKFLQQGITWKVLPIQNKVRVPKMILSKQAEAAPAGHYIAVRVHLFHFIQPIKNSLVSLISRLSY